MAFSVKVAGLPLAFLSKGPAWEIKGVPWPEHELRSDPRFKEFHTDPGYLDYEGVLPLTEALEINARFIDIEPSHLKAKIDELQRALEGSVGCLKWVRVQISEWESGLG